MPAGADHGGRRQAAVVALSEPPGRGYDHRHPHRSRLEGHDLYAVTAMVLRPGSAGEKGGAGVTPPAVPSVSPTCRSNAAIASSTWRWKRTRRWPRSAPQGEDQGAGRQRQSALVTLSAVDAGILNITNFKSPDPLMASFLLPSCATGTTSTTSRPPPSRDGRPEGKLKWGDAAPKPTKSLPRRCAW